MCVVLFLSNYLLQPLDNNGGLIKAKPGGVYRLVLQLPNLPAIHQQDRNDGSHMAQKHRERRVFVDVSATSSTFCLVFKLLGGMH